jgi:hypothetical protein
MDAGGVEAFVGLMMGYPASWVKDHAYVAKLGGKARQLLAERRISLEIARELAKLGDKERADGWRRTPRARPTARAGTR